MKADQKIKFYKYLKFNRLFIAAILIFVAILFYNTSKPLEAVKNSNKILHVIAGQPIVKEISTSIEALGTAVANESVDLSANVSGTITKFNFEDGQFVSKGDIIALINQDVDQAKLAGARADIANNVKELDRLKSLLIGRHATQQQYDAKATQLEISRQTAKQMEAKIEHKTIRAPFDGILGIRKLSVGATLQSGMVIATIDDISQIKIDFNVPAINLSKLSKGMEVIAITDALPSKIFSGTITTINTRVDEATRSLFVRAIIKNPNYEIKPGLLMRVKMIQNKRQALLINEESLIQRGNNHYLYIVDKQKSVVNFKQVEIGQRYIGYVEIKSGLDKQDIVVKRGIIRLSDGQAVIIDSEDVDNEQIDISIDKE